MCLWTRQVTMACLWGSDACGAHLAFPLDPPVNRPVWIYNRTICTGLGDRVGAMLTVATLAYISNVDVEMEWCGDPKRTYAHMNTFMPQWVGYNMPLQEFKKTFKIPANIRLVDTFTNNSAPSVSYTGNELAAEETMDQVYTLASRTTRLVKPVTKEDFIRGYHVAGSQFQSRITNAVVGSSGHYVVLHMRAFDKSTPHWWDWNPASYCTHRALSMVLKHGYSVVVISNDLQWAHKALHPHNDTPGVTFSNSSAFQGMSLLLNAVGIIQHAPQGYSSFSNVPSMAHGIPLLSTFKGEKHRYFWYNELGEVPPEFFHCMQRKAFMQRLASRFGLA